MAQASTRTYKVQRPVDVETVVLRLEVPEAEALWGLIESVELLPENVELMSIKAALSAALAS